MWTRTATRRMIRRLGSDTMPAIAIIAAGWLGNRRWGMVHVLGAYASDRQGGGSKMKVLFIAAECKPFSKVGGVGDVAGELPIELKKQGVDIEIATPLYDKVKAEYIRGWEPPPYYVNGHSVHERIEWFLGDLSGVPVHFAQCACFGPDPYVNSAPVPYLDDVRRFSVFSEACLQLIERLGPEVVHINDWGLGYLFGRMATKKMPQRRILTVHNVGYQGNVGIGSLPQPSILRDIMAAHGEAFTDPRSRWRSVNALRLALELADKVNAVSPTYAAEMTQPENPDAFFEGGKGLDGVARNLANSGRLIGILNGYEYKTDPSDQAFEQRLELKESEKSAIAKYGCFRDPDAFLLGFVGRAVEQKFRLLTEIIDGKPVLQHILDMPGVNVAVLATGLPLYERFLRGEPDVMHEAEAERRPWLPPLKEVQQLPDDPKGKSYVTGNYLAVVDFQPETAARISIGCDVFLMPSLFEPCGITQLESMSNATPPLVRRTGGLADTVVPYTKPGGTGFVFDGDSRDAVLRSLLDSVREAVQVFREEKTQFRRLQREAFNQRFLWATSARTYIEELYANPSAGTVQCSDC